MGIGVLGPLAVDRGEGVSPRDRVVPEALVVRVGTVVDKEVLADALWGDTPPASWAVVHGCVARLRRVLGPATVGRRRTVTGWLCTTTNWMSADSKHSSAEPGAAGIGRCRPGVISGGGALAGEGRHIRTSGGAGRAGDRLDDLRLTADELPVEAEIRGGRSIDVLNDARSMVAEAPLREKRWALLARALYQAGRQSDSLEVVGRARRMLRDELGLDPGPELVALERAILRQDPGLAAIDSQPTSNACPYRGLLPYEAEDADSFFGRDADVGACLKLLRERGTLAIVGPPARQVLARPRWHRRSPAARPQGHRDHSRTAAGLTRRAPSAWAEAGTPSSIRPRTPSRSVRARRSAGRTSPHSAATTAS
jgi:DNA-binding SARP family transcriptional activator